MKQRSRPASYAEREASLLRILRSKYEGLDDLAADCLAALEGAPYDEQCQLFKILLTRCGTVADRTTLISGRDTVSSREWNARAGYMQALAEQWSRAALRQNATAEETAREIWDDLTLVEGTDRIIALGLLLGTCPLVVPYAQLPAHLLRILPARVYAEAHDRHPESVALIGRLIKDESVGTLEAAEATVRTLEGIDEREGRVALLADLFEIVKKYASMARRSEELPEIPEALRSLLFRVLGRLLSDFQSGHGSAPAEDHET